MIKCVPSPSSNPGSRVMRLEAGEGFSPDAREQGITVVQSDGYEGVDDSFQIFGGKKQSNP